MHRYTLSLLMVAWCLTLAGCGEKPVAPAPSAAPQKHEHQPPHGGTVIELGEEEFHVELVLDATAGRLSAYVLDGHLENFIRLPLAAFEISARVAGKDEPLTFKAMASTATGETVGDTSQFDAQADWLRGAKTFVGVLKELTVKGKSYKDVKFSFPKGNE